VVGRRALVASLVAVATVVVAASPTARAQNPDDASPESRAQIANAVRTLEPLLAAPGRSVARGAPGTIEHAILGYAPQKPWAVAEGALPPVRGGACPSEMASVGGRFCVDRWEGSLLVRTEGGGMEPWPHNQPPMPERVYVARSAPGVFPQGYVSGAQAEAACKAASKRLCQPVEWRAACGGSQGHAYPYGPKRSPGKCKDSGVAPMMTLHAETMKRGWGMSELNDPRNSALDGTVAKTGSFPGCVTDQGAFDMVGNLHEWTADPNGTFQGGYWLDTSQHGEGCAYRTIAHGFGYHDYSTGFRCCKDPS